MIYFFTGAPGTFKTYSAIHFARDLSAGKRPVFAHGVTDLREPGWTVIDADQVRNWRDELPPGAVLICDEVSSLVPQRVKGDTPSWVDALRTHRHHGLDLIFVTQHPMDVDVVFRRLVGEHRHFYRQFGRRKVSWLRYDQCDDSPDPGNPKPGQTIETRGVDRSVFKVYKSTVQDTHRLRIPRKILLAFAFLVAAVLLAYFMVGRFTEGRIAGDPVPQLTADSGRPIADKLDQVHPLERPQCIAWAARAECRCYSQQGNRMTGISLAECRHIVEYGYFDPSLEKPEKRGG